MSRRSIISEEAGRRDPKHSGAVIYCVGKEGRKVVMDTGQCTGVAIRSRVFSLGGSIFFSKVDREMISREQEGRS